MATRITTWNINSLRLRLAALRRVVAEEQPDVLCLQETKCSVEQFPKDAVAGLGFPHQLMCCAKGHAGVAIASRRPIEAGPSRNWCGREDGRHVTATLPGGIELHNFYVPSGGDVPDPAVNARFAHKLRFLEEMAEWFAAMAAVPRILVGDLNVAPLENDVWSHKQLLDAVSHTPGEVERLGKVMATLGWVDAVRHFVPPSERLYTWWSYRNQTWPGSDRGRRLDHVWVTPALRPALRSASVLRAARGWKRPSDHVPVTVEIEV